jgi:hypothetical protein
MPKYSALRHEKSNPAAKSSAACSNPAESRGEADFGAMLEYT